MTSLLPKSIRLYQPGEIVWVVLFATVTVLDDPYGLVGGASGLSGSVKPPPPTPDVTPAQSVEQVPSTPTYDAFRVPLPLPWSKLPFATTLQPTLRSTVL